jgi:penicillin-binding protein 1C
VNYDRQFRGPVTLRRALANSLNVPAVRLLDELGGASSLHQLMTGPLRFTGLDPDPQYYGLGLTLGTAEVRLLELTNAYACLARLGVAKPWRLTASQQGRGVDQSLFDRDACWILADILSDNLARAEAFGLDSPLRLPFRVAAKTGTSTDYRDNWTLGFTPDFTVGVWVGHFGNAPLQNVSGVSGAGPIFREVMMQLHRNQKPGWYLRPANLTAAKIDPFNGKRLVEASLAAGSKGGMNEVFRRGNLPDPAGRADYDDRGRVKLSPIYADWLASEGRYLETRLTTNSDDPPVQKLRIVSPLPGTVAYLDPDLPGGGKRFPLKYDSERPVQPHWASETLEIEIEPESGRAWLILEPGEHTVVVTDPVTGMVSETTLAVEVL